MGMGYHCYPKVVIKGTEEKRRLIYLLFPLANKAVYLPSDRCSRALWSMAEL